MNAKGHQIREIFIGGGQARNLLLMQLFADTCRMPVVVPVSSSSSDGGGDSGAVVLGAAMLGRFAVEVGEGMGKGREQAELLWKIMVRFLSFLLLASGHYLRG